MTCAPTYATSHRFGWPDERGVMRCACGASSDERSSGKRPCEMFAPAARENLYTDDKGHDWYLQLFEQDRTGTAVAWASGFPMNNPVAFERQRCKRLSGTHWTPLAGHDVPSLDNLPAECCSAADYTSEQLDFLDSSDAIDLRWSAELREWRWVKRDDSGRGLTWVGPDVQDAVMPDLAYVIEAAQALTLRDLLDETERAGRRRRDAAEAMSTGRVNSHGSLMVHGGIVRLGLELREVDGVTAR